MRFLEHHLQTIAGSKDAPLARAIVPIDVNSVADWYFQESDVERYALRDQFPSGCTPFPVTFFEYRVPTKWKVRDEKGEWVMAEVNNGGCHIGILMMQERLPDNYTGGDMDEGLTISNVRSALKEDPGYPRFRQYMTIYAGTKEKITRACSATIYLDENGGLMGGPYHDVDPLIIERQHKSEAEAYSEFVRVYAFPMLFATSLLTCKNVSLVERPASADDIKKAIKRKTRAYSYRQIVVDALRKSVVAGDHGGGNTVMTALRIGRGHWKDYREGKGLFGKFHGRFWWDAYVSGDQKVVDDIREKSFNELRSYKVKA